MRVSVYIDGFNLYYRALRKTAYRKLRTSSNCVILNVAALGFCLCKSLSKASEESINI